MTNWWSHIWVFLCEECFDPIWLFWGPWWGIIGWSKVNWILMTEPNESWASAHFPASRASTVVAASWRRNSVARRPSRSEEHQVRSTKNQVSTKPHNLVREKRPFAISATGQLWGSERRTSKENLLVSYFQTGDIYADGENVTFLPDDGWRVKGNWQLSNENVIRRLITRNGSSESVKRRP